MSHLVHIRVLGPDGRTLVDARHAAPFSIGRGADNKVRFGHEPEDVTISRLHAWIRVEDGRLTVADNSANGTVHGGRRLSKGESAALRDQDEITIQGHRIVLARIAEPARPGAPPPLSPPPPPPAFNPPPPAAQKPSPALPPSSHEPVAFTAVPGGGSGSKSFGIGPLSLAIEVTPTGGRLQAVESADAAAILAALRGSGRDVIAVISARAGVGSLTVAPEAAGKGLTLNLFEVKAGVYPVAHLDIVTLGQRLRVELINKGERFLRCQRGSCRRLNPYTPNVNCRFCGTKLIEALTGFVEA